MGIGPVFAVPKLLKQTGLKVEDIDLWELNEAFAVQVIYCRDRLGIPDDRLNVNGGAIAVGHPYGMSGAAARRPRADRRQAPRRQDASWSRCASAAAWARRDSSKWRNRSGVAKVVSLMVVPDHRDHTISHQRLGQCRFACSAIARFRCASSKSGWIFERPLELARSPRPACPAIRARCRGCCAPRTESGVGLQRRAELGDRLPPADRSSREQAAEIVVRRRIGLDRAAPRGETARSRLVSLSR